MLSILLAKASEAAEGALLSAGEDGSAAKKMGERDTDELVVVLSRHSTAGTVILIGTECGCGKSDTFVADADVLVGCLCCCLCFCWRYIITVLCN